MYNFTNPGAIRYNFFQSRVSTSDGDVHTSHNEVLDLYRRYIDPSFKWTNFTVEEQAQVIKAPRSNTELVAGKLKQEYPALLDIHAAMEACFQRMRKNLSITTPVAE